MKLKITKSNLLEFLLGPVSKISDNLCLSFEGKSFVKTIVASSDNSLVLFTKLPCETDCNVKCVIPDCKTFLRLFSSITDSEINLIIEDNYIEYKGKDLSFKYHLLDESYVVNKKSLSEEKINNLTFDTTFTITKRFFSEIAKYHSILPDSEKLYFFNRDQEVIAKIGDLQKANSNELIVPASAAYNGLPPTDNAPINIQSVLLMSFAEDQIQVSVNHDLKVYKFSTNSISYIAFGLVK
jgi:hypothetical protein